MADHLSECDRVTFQQLAILERTTPAEQRRKALAAYARNARRRKQVGELVGLIMAARQEREQRHEDSNVIKLRRNRG